MTLSLSPDLQRLIEERVKSGRYRSAEDVVAAALATLEQQDRFAELSPSELEAAFPGLREKVQHGLAQARAGQVTDGDEFFDKLEREEGAA